MSYFMTVAGDTSSLRLDGINGLRLVPMNEAQKYILALSAEIQETDGSPLFLVDDGESGTSHNIVVDAENNLHENGTLDGTTLLKLMEQFTQSGNYFRIWYASNTPSSHNSGEICTSLWVLIDRLKEQAAEGRHLQIRFLPLKE
jgi:hypothetical protein